eukprot:2671214-Amphidinium_carterae.1
MTSHVKKKSLRKLYTASHHHAHVAQCPTHLILSNEKDFRIVVPCCICFQNRHGRTRTAEARLKVSAMR